MASVSSASPHSFTHMESGDESDSWQYVESNPASVGFMPSPASSSMNSWGIVGYPNQVQASPAAMSPLQLDHDHSHGAPPTSYPNQTTTNSVMTSSGADSQLMPAFDEQSFMASQDIFFNEQLTGEFQRENLIGTKEKDSVDFNMGAVDMNMTQYYSTFQGNMGDMTTLEGFEMAPQPVDLGIPQQFRNGNDVSPWAPMNLKNEDFPPVLVDETNSFTTPSPRQQSPSHSHSSFHSSPGSPYVKIEHRKSASPIRKVRDGYKIEKKKAESSSKFVIMTPNLINQHSGKPNPFECFEALRTTQRGRKGPLAHETKESALQVRRLGACFCCHR